MAFVINETSVDVSCLANLVCWCLDTGIYNVSLYDHRGQLKSRQEELVTALAERGAAKKKAVMRVRNKDSSASYDMCSGRLVGDDSDVTCDVSLLSAEDGKGDVSGAAASIAADVRSGALDDADIDVQLVGSRLRTNRGMPDPDMMVRFGRASSNMGFLPWQVRLTEIHDHPSHRHCGKRDFDSLLLKYSNCQQRFGK